MIEQIDLTERLIQYWRDNGATVCVEASAHIEWLRARVERLEEATFKLGGRSLMLSEECDDLRARCNKLTHLLQEHEAREQ
jgi:hypothetical protein